MSQSRIEGDLYVNGNVSSKTLTPPTGSVTNASIIGAAGIAATKLDHQHRPTFAQDSDATATAVTRVIHQVRGATGTITAFAAGCVVACIGDSTIDVDLLKNGVSVLSAAITIDSGDAARAAVAGTVSSAAVVAGDVLEVAITVTAGTGTLGEGVFAALTLEEKAQ